MLHSNDKEAICFHWSFLFILLQNICFFLPNYIKMFSFKSIKVVIVNGITIDFKTPDDHNMAAIRI